MSASARLEMSGVKLPVSKEGRITESMLCRFPKVIRPVLEVQKMEGKKQNASEKQEFLARLRF